MGLGGIKSMDTSTWCTHWSEGKVQGRFILFSYLFWELVIADVREDEDTQSEVEFGVGSRARTQDRAQPNISGSGVEV